MAYGDLIGGGTLTGAAGASAVTGDGVAWASGPMPVRAGDELYLSGAIYPIREVLSDTALTLAVPLIAAAQSTAYAIRLSAPTRLTSAQIAASITDLAASARFLASSGLAIGCVDINATTPPATPVSGDTYALGAAPVGVWSGRGGGYARWTGTAWWHTPAQPGQCALRVSTGEMYYRSAAGAWVPILSNAPADILAKLKTVDGTGSGLDADLVRGVTPSAYGLARLSDATAASALSGLGAQPALGYVPIQQGGGTNQSGNKVYIGLANVATGANHLRLQVDDWDFGAAWPITPTGSVQQGGGASQGANRVYIGWADAAAGGNHLRAQVDALDLGRIWTDFSAPRSLTVPGHHTFPTGLIQQGGVSAAVEIGYVVFPITFPNAVITVVCTGMCGAEVGTMPSIGMTNISNSTFSFINRYVGGSGSSMSVRANPNPFRWFAMGF